jgi:hypothetical protein
MLSFELTAIDVILAMAVLILFVLYWTKLSNIPDEQISQEILTRNTGTDEITSNSQNSYTEWTRGFEKIKRWITTFLFRKSA